MAEPWKHHYSKKLNGKGHLCERNTGPHDRIHRESRFEVIPGPGVEGKWRVVLQTVTKILFGVMRKFWE